MHVYVCVSYSIVEYFEGEGLTLSPGVQILSVDGDVELCKLLCNLKHNEHSCVLTHLNMFVLLSIGMFVDFESHTSEMT